MTTNHAADFDRTRRLRFAGITAETTAYLSLFWRYLEPELPGILDLFYRHLESEPELAKLLANHIERLKKAQAAHWSRLFAGRFDGDYMQGGVLHRYGS